MHKRTKLISVIFTALLACSLIVPISTQAASPAQTALRVVPGTNPAAAAAANVIFLPSTRGAPGNGVASGQVPNFTHVIVMIFENREYSSVIGSSTWPKLNALAKQYALLTKYDAVAHPSLPNYIADTSGGTQGITSDCNTCYVNVTNLADSIEASGRTWKGYMESMPSPCFLGNSGTYAQKHNPFVYYDDIRTNSARCTSMDVPLTQFDTDLANNHLPDYAWITPNLCNDGHDCSNSVADSFLGSEVSKILASASFDQNSLLVITFDEGSTKASCCGLPSSAGGHIVTLLISKLVKAGYQDATPYSSYSLLKTVEKAWSLPYLGHAADAATSLITAPWR
jgi:phosphatidylinositol-3-phosphatase